MRDETKHPRKVFMQLISYRRNCLGTMSFTMKIGKMRKEKEFVVYPLANDAKKICLQARGFWAEMDFEGNILCTKNHGDFANNLSLVLDKMQGVAMTDKATSEQLNEMLTAIRGTSGKCVGTNGLVYCNNEGADKV